MTTALTDGALDVWLAEHLFGGITHNEVHPWPPPGVPSMYAFDVSGPHFDTVAGGIMDSQPYSSTGDGMLLVLEAMRARDWYIDMAWVEAAWHVTVIAPAGYFEQESDTSLPRAVAEAAKAALEAS